MSMVICEHCDRHIDSDNDPDCFCADPWGGNQSIVCESCRERAYDDYQERLMETGGGPTLIEQQRAAYKIKHGVR